MGAATLDTYLAFAALVRLGLTMFARSRTASLRPVTTAAIALYAAVAAAIASHMVSVEQLSLRDELVSTEPWRLVGCLLAYERVPALAQRVEHAQALVQLGELPLVPRARDREPRECVRRLLAVSFLRWLLCAGSC